MTTHMSLSASTVTTPLNEETTAQFPFLRKLYNFARADARNLFERGYYCNFALKTGYPTALDTTELTITRDVSYRTSSPHPAQRLDIIRPAVAEAPLPVFLFVHGGAWRSADKSGFLKVHENLCVALAKKGVVCVNVNHRLAPEHQFPTAEQDVAAAIAWTHRHVAEYGGDPERLLVGGHSSGGHLTALVATDSSYLGKHSLHASQVIKGIVSLSGVMDINDFYHDSWFMRTQAVQPYFGKDTTQYSEASPMHHLSEATPPTFLAHAERHDEGLDEQARSMERMLKEKGVFVQRQAYPNSDHFLILSKVNEPSYSLVDDIYSFIAQTIS